MINKIAGLMLVMLGLYTMISSIKDLDVFMNGRKAQFWVRKLGRKGARYFYAILGLALFIYGAVTLVK